MRKGKHKVFIISGPSRVGKEVITNALVRKRSLSLTKAITATTRKRREGEIPGKHFYFFTPEEFQQKITEGYFLEWVMVWSGRYYGTPRHELRRIFQAGRHALLNIEVHGASHIARRLRNVVRIFIKPDSLANLKKRMKRAGFTRAEIVDRMARVKRELAASKEYDHIVVNREGHLQETIREVAGIIESYSSIKTK